MASDLFSWSENISILNDLGDLSLEQAQWAMREILDDRASNDEIKDFLLAIKAKGESAEEVGAMVDEMYRHAAPFQSKSEQSTQLAPEEMVRTRSTFQRHRRSSLQQRAHVLLNTETVQPLQNLELLISWKHSGLQ
jgi:polyhydroxyalkanoate synthesis regulator phasin